MGQLLAGVCSITFFCGRHFNNKREVRCSDAKLKEFLDEHYKSAIEGVRHNIKDRDTARYL